MKKILVISLALVFLAGCGAKIENTELEPDYVVKVTPVEVEGGIKNINEAPGLPEEETAAEEKNVVVYKNTEQGFSFEYPDSFTIEKDDYLENENESFMDFSEVVLHSQDYPSVYFTVFVNHPGMGWEGYNDYKENESYKIGGDQAELMYLESEGTRFISTYWEHSDDDQYIIMLKFESDLEKSTAEDTFKDILDSWEFAE